MKKLLFFSCLITAVFSLEAQNIVPNPSFENYSALPTNLGLYNSCNQWGNAGSSVADPDYFHVDGSLLADLPVTSMAEVIAADGEAVMGIMATGKQGENFREYLSVKLSAPTIIGQKYRASFKITNGSVYNHSLTGMGTSQIGVLLSKNTLVQSGNDPIIATPQFEIDEVTYSREWKQVSFSFIATEEFEYLYLGVFNDDSDLSIEFREGNPTISRFAYYFFDEVSLKNIPLVPTLAEDHDRGNTEPVSVSLDSEFPFYVPNAFTPDNNGNNDSFRIVSGKEGVHFTVSVFDRWGNKIYSATNGHPEWDGKCAGEPCPNDIYVWLVVYDEIDELTGENVKRERSGTIHLIR